MTRRTAGLLLLAACGSLAGTEEGVVFLDVVRPPVTTLEVGATLQLQAIASDARGEPIAATISWRSADEFLAVEETTGLVTALAAGIGGRIQARTGTGSRQLLSEFIVLTVVEPPDPPAP